MTQLAQSPFRADGERTSPDRADPFDELVARLRVHGVGAHAPRVGERFPDFALPDPMSRYSSLGGLVSGGPVVLSFNRGGWCDHCRAELARWALHRVELERACGRLVSISAEVGDPLARLPQLVAGRFQTLCDIDHGVALQAGLAFRCDDGLRRRYRRSGVDLDVAYGSGSGFLTIPATFAVDARGIVRFASVEPDFRIRADPADVIAALAQPPAPLAETLTAGRSHPPA